jgi:hypothetical protein
MITHSGKWLVDGLWYEGESGISDAEIQDSIRAGRLVEVPRPKFDGPVNEVSDGSKS